MNFGKNPHHDFPKMRGGGSTAVWNFSENSSIFEGTGFPKSNSHKLACPEATPVQNSDRPTQ